jgi:hypothetical protein
MVKDQAKCVMQGNRNNPRVTGMAWLVMPTCLLALSCTQVPELDATIPESLLTAPYPALIPLEYMAPTGASPREDAEQIENELAARRERLAARAAALNAPILDEAARERLKKDIAR